MDTSSPHSPHPASSETRHEGRLVKKMPAWEPLEEERRYVKIHASHVSVFTGFFSWALRVNRLGKYARRPVKLDSPRAKGEARRDTEPFTSYFSLGTGRDPRPRDSGHELNIHRNRVVFWVLLSAALLYSLIWISR